MSLHTMSGLLLSALLLAPLAIAPNAALAQEETSSTVTTIEETPGGTTVTTTKSVEVDPSAAGSDVRSQAEKLAADAQRQISDVARKVDQDARAKDVTAGILQPIYLLAENMSFPFFHWTAFMLMAAGVVSYAFQLVLGKLVVLSRMGFSPAEIISDAVGLLISLIGLVLTTQAAAENSTFTQSPAAVLSATIVGALFGFVLYLWGQRQELQATAARTIDAATRPRE